MIRISKNSDDERIPLEPESDYDEVIDNFLHLVLPDGGQLIGDVPWLGLPSPEHDHHNIYGSKPSVLEPMTNPSKTSP